MKIHLVQTGDVQIKSHHLRSRFKSFPARAADILFDPQWTPRLPIMCWVIEHEEGLLVVDTGESCHANDPGYQPWWHPLLRTCGRRWVAPEQEVGPRMRAIGLDPRDVRWVVMTHMHGDHAGGIDHFPSSQILMTDIEARMAFASAGPLYGFLNAHYPPWLKPVPVRFSSGPWESFDASFALTKDGAIHLVPSPGHSLGHLSVALETDRGVVLLAGDAAYSEAALLEGIVDGVALDGPAHRDSTARLRELCRRRAVVTQFAHDAGSLRRLENNTPTQISWLG